MSDSNAKRTHGMMAEFDSVDSLIAASRRIRDAGYTKTDAYTPFAVHGIDEALGIKPTALPWIALAGGAIGTITALAMQIWMNSINYPYIISGKPFISLPAFIPVAFELTILFASFGSFFGMLALNRLPRFSNPVFTNPRFDSVTDDKFFLYVDAQDARYDPEGVARLLADAGAASVEPVVEDESPATVPKVFVSLAGMLAMLAIIPVLVIALMRVTTSTQPRFHIFYDMDFSPAKDAQTTTTLFADGRVMRPDVPGTVARGQSGGSDDFYTGVDSEALAAMEAARNRQLVALNAQPPAEDAESPAAAPSESEGAVSEAEQPAAEAGSADAAPSQAGTPAADGPADANPGVGGTAGGESGAETGKPRAAAGQDSASVPAAPAASGNGQAGEAVDTTPWLKQNPLKVTEELLAAGQQQFNIYCAVCHGVNGRGTGLVHDRAQRIQSPTWVQPTSMHQDYLYADKYPDGKLFSVITNGIRKMPGYAAQIPPERRWAIVAYVRALQLSQNAEESDVPPAQRAATAQAD